MLLKVTCFSHFVLKICGGLLLVLHHHTLLYRGHACVRVGASRDNLVFGLAFAVRYTFVRLEDVFL